MDLNKERAKKENNRQNILENKDVILTKTRSLIAGHDLQDWEDHLNFRALNIAAERYRKKVHAQDVAEEAIHETTVQRQATLDKLNQHAQLLEVKIQRRLKLKENVARDLNQMDMKEIGEELEYLRKGNFHRNYVLIFGNFSGNEKPTNLFYRLNPQKEYRMMYWI